MTKTLTIPTNFFMWARFSTIQRYNSVANDDPLMVFLLAASSGGSRDGNNCVCLNVNTESSQVNFQSYRIEGGSVYDLTSTASFYNFGSVFEYIGIQKLSSAFHMWAFSSGGQSLYIGNVPAYTGPSLDRAGVLVVNSTTNTPGNIITGVDFIRFVESSTFLP
jgi:hypothetical protein